MKWNRLLGPSCRDNECVVSGRPFLWDTTVVISSRLDWFVAIAQVSVLCATKDLGAAASIRLN